MGELKGSLGGIGLPALIQLLGELHETGRLELAGHRLLAELGFDDGQLVSADFGDERGLSALAGCMLTLADGEFTFQPGLPPRERTIIVGPDQIRAHLREIAATRNGAGDAIPSLDSVPRLNVSGETDDAREHVVLERGAIQLLPLIDGESSVRQIIGTRPVVPALRDLAMLAEAGFIYFLPPPPAVNQPTDATLPSRATASRVHLVTATSNGTPPALTINPASADETALGICPRLGFADDRGRHYSRPTALHRCYASGNGSLVSTPEQRDLCLSGRYPTCPRFTSATAEVPPAPVPSPVRLPAPPPAAVPSAPRPAVPPGVAARMATANRIGLPRTPTQADEVPPWIGSEHPATPKARLIRRPPTWLVVGLVGAIVLAAGGLFAFQLLRGGGPPQAAPTSVPAVVVVPPAATQAVVARATVVVAGATALSQPSLVPTAAGAATPQAAVLINVPPAATATAQSAGRTLLDARFAGGAQDSWVENPPYATWSSGAYRLKAAQQTHFVAISAPLEAPADALISATLRKTGGPPGGGYGLIVRDQGPTPRDGINQDLAAYVFEAGDLGDVGVWRRDGDHWVDLLPWTRSTAVRQGGSPNDLRVRAVGSRLVFAVNGVEVASIDDATLPNGGVGVFVGGDLNEVALDRFTVQTPN